MSSSSGPGSTGLAPSGRVRITSRSQGSSAALVTVTVPVVGSCFLSQRFLGSWGVSGGTWWRYSMWVQAAFGVAGLSCLPVPGSLGFS